ncbi:hypothetical protein ACFXPV_38710 [Streptomyces sp. NPDC059118]|uniref:hypothetical protein n=1 Tax=unclassified Streptomyces TaxID=2593676 RepID=UPI0036A2F18A
MQMLHGDQPLTPHHTPTTDRRRLHRQDAHTYVPLPRTTTEQLLAGLDQRTTTLTAQIATLARDVGTPGPDIEARAALLRAEITTARITAAALLPELSLVLHHTVRGDDSAARGDIARLEEPPAPATTPTSMSPTP